MLCAYNTKKTICQGFLCDLLINFNLKICIGLQGMKNYVLQNQLITIKSHDIYSKK